jgi:hypothetical protein
MPEITLTNAAGRDAQVAADSIKLAVRIPRLDREGRECSSTRILKGTLQTGLPAIGSRLSAESREPMAGPLIQGDPEIDRETVGRLLRPGDSSRVWVNPDGRVVHAVTHSEIVRNPDGTEKARRPHALAAANLYLPLVWSGKLIPRAEAVRKFVFTQARQIRHVNGLTYDFLFAIAQELAAKDALLLIGPGPKGTSPLVLHKGALPYRGFLEGRVAGASYCLILHLCNLELKAPDAVESKAQEVAA